MRDCPRTLRPGVATGIKIDCLDGGCPGLPAPTAGTSRCPGVPGRLEPSTGAGRYNRPASGQWSGLLADLQRMLIRMFPGALGGALFLGRVQWLLLGFLVRTLFVVGHDDLLRLGGLNRRLEWPRRALTSTPVYGLPNHISSNDNVTRRTRWAGCPWRPGRLAGRPLGRWLKWGDVKKTEKRMGKPVHETISANISNNCSLTRFLDRCQRAAGMLVSRQLKANRPAAALVSALSTRSGLAQRGSPRKGARVARAR